jgi:predicted metalloprotease with PDZ domain
VRKVLLAGLSFLLAGPAFAAPHAAATAYTVTPEVKDGVLQDLSVEMKFTGDADGETRIALPKNWSGADQLYRAIHDVAVDGGSFRMDGPADVVVKASARAPLTLRYRVIQDFQGELSADAGSPFRPVTRPKWFTSVGWALFPEIQGRRRDPVSFRWGAAPQGWTMASDLDRLPKDSNVDDLLDSVLVGGEGMNIVERQVAGGSVRIAFHGRWRFTEAQFADLMSRIASTSADFWKDHGEHYFAAVTPMTAQPGATVQYGVGLGDAFSLWATQDVDEPGLRHILAHEHQHTWFPSRMGGVRSGADEPLDYWLSEGFTDFYTLRILLRSGVWSLEDFTADYNRILRAYAASPARDAPNAVVKAKFWNDRDVADLPYQRGLLLAALWDDRLRRATGGARNLDDVVLKMRDDAASGPASWRGAPANLQVAYKALGGPDLAPDYARYVDGGARVLLPADLFGDCATVRTFEVPKFDRGFDPTATSAQGGVVNGVDPQGPAYAAGLRNGMRIVRREAGRTGDSAVDLVYRVEDGGVQKVIRYRPEGRVRITYQEIQLATDMNADKRARCVRVMGGLAAATPAALAPSTPLKTASAQGGGGPVAARPGS